MLWSHRPTLVFTLIRMVSDSDGGGVLRMAAGLLFVSETCSENVHWGGSLLVFPRGASIHLA